MSESQKDKNRKTPISLLDWDEAETVWTFMIIKEENLLKMRNSNLFEETNFQPSVRMLLLDWLMKVSAAFRLRRVTYYLCVDYFDRFISINPKFSLEYLKLVGVTCLFIATKLTEFRRPSLSDFCTIPNAAISRAQIIVLELVILSSLNWEMDTMTPIDWLNLYMQINYNVDNLKRQKLHMNVHKQFVFPHLLSYDFIRASLYIDLFSFDPAYLKFTYSTIAAAAMYILYGDKALTISGLTWNHLKSCVEYMKMFKNVLNKIDYTRLEYKEDKSKKKEELDDEGYMNSYINTRFNDKQLCKEDVFILQTHMVDKNYFAEYIVTRLQKMGLRAQKNCIGKSKLRDGEELDNDDTDNIFFEVYSYNVERLTDDIGLTDEAAATVSTNSDVDFIIPENTTATFSLNEILTSFIKYDKNNIRVQSNTNEEIPEAA